MVSVVAARIVPAQTLGGDIFGVVDDHTCQIETEVVDEEGGAEITEGDEEDDMETTAAGIPEG